MTVKYKVRLAQTSVDLQAAQRLRYRVFVKELGATVSDACHELEQEFDAYDDICEHLLLIDIESNQIVGVYRLLCQDSNVSQKQNFYSATEYDLAVLIHSGKKLLELGRSCIAPEHRKGGALQFMWMALGAYVMKHNVDLMFGTASFKGTDTNEIAQPLSCLHYFFMAQETLCPKVRFVQGQSIDMNILPQSDVQRTVAMRDMPALIKGYLRLGGKVGEGAFIDHAFNTTDVLILTQTDQIAEKYMRMYGDIGQITSNELINV